MCRLTCRRSVVRVHVRPLSFSEVRRDARVSVAGRAASAEDRPRPLEPPGGGEGAHRVDRHAPHPRWHEIERAARGAAEREDGQDERELPQLDAGVERHERERDVARREPRRAQGCREAEAVEEAEDGGHRPGPAPHERRRGGPAGQLDGQREDARADRRLDRPRGQVGDAERRQAERHTVPGGERRHRREQAADGAREQEEAEDEQQVIGPREDVFDAEAHVVTHDVEHARPRRHGEERTAERDHAAHDAAAVARQGGRRTLQAALMRWTSVLVLVALLGTARGAGPPPWARTETRAPCRTFDLFRSPYFGELHVHTRFSADAYIFGTRITPPDVYAFARGGTIPLADDDEQQTRSATIDRPLDFAAVTDHAEFFGEVRVCDTPSSPAFDSHLCQILKQAEPPSRQFPTIVNWLFPAGIPDPPHLSLCQTPGVDCSAAAVSAWQDEQAAAAAAYDRTSACAFTTFIGYEYTASPIGRHLHRNIIFRNEHVPAAAASYIETAGGGIPQGVWSAIETECLNAGTGCEAVIIPHT